MRALVALLLSAGAAAADCPGPGALADGIVVETLRGEEHFSRGTGGVVIVSLRPEDAGFVEITEYAGGVLPVRVVNTPDPDSDGQGYAATIDFDRAALDAILPLEPGDMLGLPARYIRDTPEISVELALELEVRGNEPVSIGDCDYTALQVEYRIIRPDGTFRTMLQFLPDLGIAYAVGRALPDGDMDNADATAIRRAAD